MFKLNSFVRLLPLMFLLFSSPLLSMNQQTNFEECIIREDCPVCLEHCDNNNDFVLPCCHQLFHFNCLEEWMQNGTNCPMCRTEFNLEHLRQEYENQIRAREERERLLIEEDERQVQEAIRISIEEENQRQELERQRQEAERQRQELERQRLEVERQRIEAENIRLETERQRFEAENRRQEIERQRQIEEVAARVRVEQQRREEQEHTLQTQTCCLVCEPQEQQNLIRDVQQRRCLELPNLQQLNSQELLHHAILHDSIEVIREAVHAGANVNQERDGKLPILWAVLLKKSNAVDALLECGAKGSEELAGFSISLGNFAPAMAFVKSEDIGPGVSCLGSRGTLLTLALKLGEVEDAISLLRMGANFAGKGAVGRIANPIMEFIFDLFSHPYFENGKITLELILILIPM